MTSPPPLHPKILGDLRSAASPAALAEVTQALARAAAALEDDRPDEALPPALEVKRRAPRSRHGREILGLVYYRLGRFPEAVAELRAYRRMSGDSGRDVVLADAERAVGKTGDASRRLEAVVADPAVGEDERTEARIVLAAIEADAGRFDEARATLGRGPVEPRRLEEHHLRLWYALGDVEERAGRPDDARRWFEKVNSAEPGWGDAAEKLKRLRRRRGG